MMHRALFLTLVIATAPLAALIISLDFNEDQIENEFLGASNGEVFLASKTATNPLGWEWVTKDYDAGYVWTRSVEADPYGNSYISGVFRGGSLSLDHHHANNNGGLDVFIAKFSSQGDCIWLTTFGGSLNEHVEDMIVDPAGDLYVVGSYDSPQFNASTSILNNSGSRDGPMRCSKESVSQAMRTTSNASSE